MNIGQISKETGISAKMIRYYEQIGLIQAVERSASGYRLYSGKSIKSLNFIRHARSLGFSLEQIKSLLELWENPNRQSADVKQLAIQHIEDLNKKIQSMQNMVETLKLSIETCSGNQSSNCSILEQIEHGTTRTL